MAKVRIPFQVHHELEEIWIYVAPDDEQAADRLVNRLLNEIGKLGQRPGMGRSRDDIAEGIRSWPCGSYVIYYRLADDIVEILHVVHGARSTDKFFPPEH
jgi:toxin ParE1/3/4